MWTPFSSAHHTHTHASVLDETPTDWETNWPTWETIFTSPPSSPFTACANWKQLFLRGKSTKSQRHKYKKTTSTNQLQFSGQMWVFTRLGAAAAASCVPVPQLRSPPSCQTRPNVHRSFTLSIRINNITWDRMINTLTTFPFPSKGITCYHQSYQQIRPTPQTLLILSTSFIRINKIGRINTFDLCPKIK